MLLLSLLLMPIVMLTKKECEVKELITSKEDEGRKKEERRGGTVDKGNK